MGEIKMQENSIRGNLATALNLLDFKTKESAYALFHYLHIAGYLGAEAIDKAVNYLSIEKPFAVDPETVKKNLKTAYELANQNNQFDVEIFCQHFAKEDYFSPADIIDLLTFIQQTAFDRNFGIERDKLQAKPWMEEKENEFMLYANELGIVKACNPSHKHYSFICVAGAASRRVVQRIEDYQSYDVTKDSLWALSGVRELSIGLDEESVMKEVADHWSFPFEMVTRGTGEASRQYLNGVTETMMVKYLLQKHCPENNFEMVNSGVQTGHWRTTNAQNAKDIAIKVLDGIEDGQLTKSEDEFYHGMIVAEQPYSHRFERQLQREIDKEIQRRNLNISLTVEGCGRGISAINKDVLTRMNSELGSSMAERCIDARARLGEKTIFRSMDILLFQKRDATYNKSLEMQQTSKEPEVNQKII